MRGGVILIVVALIIGYMGVTGRYKCFSSFWDCITGAATCDCKPSAQGGGGATGGVSQLFPTVAPLRPIPPLTPGIAG